MKKTILLLSTLLASNTFAEPIDVGAKLPDAVIHRANGEEVKLSEITKDQKTVFVFYRGGWCPYCNAHLAALAEIEAPLREAGWQILAISPDSPENVKAAAEKNEFPYQLLSDSDMAAAKAFGLAFTVDDETFDRLKGYGIDIEAASGQNHRMLPVPGVFLVDEQGTVTFAHHNPNYKERLSGEAILKAAGL